MALKRNIRIEYFQVMCTNTEGTERPFDFREWIAVADLLELPQRTLKYYGESARLEYIYRKSGYDYFFLNFNRLSETDIPKKAKSATIAEPMQLEEDEYIARDTTALYDLENSILAFQKNKGSVNITGSEDYVNEIWNKKEGLKIWFRPIIPPDVLKKINEKSNYRMFRIKFADMRSSDFSFNNNGPLWRMFSAINEYVPVTADVRLSMDRVQDRYLDRKNVRDTVNEIGKNKQIIAKAEVGIKADKESEFEILDLFEEKMHDYIVAYLQQRQSLSSEYIADLMIEAYKKKKPIIALQTRTL